MYKIIFYSILCVLIFTLAARADSLSSHLPPDTLGFLELDPLALNPADNSAQPGSGSMLESSVETLASLGIMPRQAAGVTSLLRLASQLGQHRSCIAWLDADYLVDYNTGGLSLRSFQIAILFDVHGQPQRILNLLTDAIKPFAQAKTVVQSVKTVPGGQRQYVEFYDSRWPDQAKLYWAMDGPYFVLALGPGSMQHYLSARPAEADLQKSPAKLPWADFFAQADAAISDSAAPPSPALEKPQIVARAYFSTKTFREKFPDVLKFTALGKAARALDQQRNDHMLLTSRARGRAIDLDFATLESGHFSSSPWTTTAAAPAEIVALVPPEAHYYVFFNMDWDALLTRADRLMDALDGRPENGAIDHLKDQTGVDLRQDLINHLSPTVLVHDAPPHPLHLPFMLTVLAQAKPGQQTAARAALDKLISHAAATLAGNSTPAAGPAENPPIGNPLPLENPPTAAGADESIDFSHVSIHTARDGIEFLQYGLVGPAWTWSGRYFVISWSPPAVRENLERLK